MYHITLTTISVKENLNPTKSEGVPELLTGVSFCVSKDSLDMYLKTVKRLGLYVCTAYNNGSDVQMCLDSKELILLEEPIMPDKCYASPDENVGPESYCHYQE